MRSTSIAACLILFGLAFEAAGASPAGIDPDPAATTPKSAPAERPHAASGASTRSFTGRIHGDAHRDYPLRGRAGQTLAVSLSSPDGRTAFSITPPGTDSAMFPGSASDKHFERILPVDGQYVIRVFSTGVAPIAGGSSAYTLDTRLSGKPLVARAHRSDARIPGTPFHASASITCAHGPAPDGKPCQAFVIRRGFDGGATVEIRHPGAHSPIRRILFIKGEPVSSDAAEPLRHARHGDLSIILIGSGERFEIPDALVFGG